MVVVKNNVVWDVDVSDEFVSSSLSKGSRSERGSGMSD